MVSGRRFVPSFAGRLVPSQGRRGYRRCDLVCTSFPCPLEAADAWCCLEPWSSYSDLMGGSQGFCPDAQEAADRISSFGEVVQGLLKTLG